MPIFISQGKYSREALKGMIANPEDRSEVVGKLIGAAGGRLLAYYVTFRAFDWMVISEMPGAKEASAISIIAAASSGTSDVRTTLAMTSAEAKEVFASTGALSGSYRAPGA
jgi:uncharacterized protein with GYD domain